MDSSLKSSKKGLCLFFSLSCFFSSTYAYTPEFVSEWTEQTLYTTLTAGYHETVSEAANVRRQYLHKGWKPMQVFFDEKLRFVNGQQVQLHPGPITPAMVLSEEVCPGQSCWQVHQTFSIPEMEDTVSFDALVTTADPAHGSALLIKDLHVYINED